jgi:integrase
VKDVTASPPSPRPPKLLDQLRHCIADKHYSLRTERAYVYWVRWYIRFHGLKHPMEMGSAEVQTLLSFLANEQAVSASAATHHQALCALLFLYRHVLGMELPWLEQLHRPPKPARRPTVLTLEEVRALLRHLSGVRRLVARLPYGPGMRLMECLQLRVKDLDFRRREILIRGGKGGKDRLTMLPVSLIPALHEQLAAARDRYDDDRRRQQARGDAAGRAGAEISAEGRAMALVLDLSGRS